MKNTQSKIKAIKIGKQSGITYCLGCKDYTKNFRPQEVKMTNKVLKKICSREISQCCLQVKQIKIFKRKNKLTIDITYKR